MSETKLSEAEQIERDALAIFERRKSRTDEQIMAASRLTATREFKAKQQQKNRQDPAFCGREAERRGLTLVAETWKGAPCQPGLAFRPNPKFIFDEHGVHVVTVDRSAAFVCSPAVQTGPRTWAVKVATGWREVTLEPGSARNDLDALRAAGLRTGSGSVLLEHGETDTDHSVPLSVIALGWLFNRGPGDEIICRPEATFLIWDTFSPNAGAVGGLSSPITPR